MVALLLALCFVREKHHNIHELPFIVFDARLEVYYDES